MSIATKTGDKGQTSLLDGERVHKNDVRIETYGTVDELNAAIGVALVYVHSTAIKEVLLQVQHDLFTIGSELSSLATKKLEIELPKTTAEHVDFLDEAVKATEHALTPQKGFILPNGTPGAAHLHMARTICRRAERRVSACDQLNPNPEIMKYLNRLSDLLFLFARAENKGKATEEYVKYK